VPFEIRRRFLIDYPDTAALEALPGCHREDLEQVYLRSEEDEEIRIRRSPGEDGEVFYLTRRRLHDGQRRLEAEGRLSEREYMQFMTNADPERRPIRKVRYRLIWNSQHYEIDLYPFWTDQAVLEVSLQEADDKITVPDFLHVQRDVSEDPCYEISYLAQKQVRESF
jgi:CYTH domain-containing protein